MKLTAAIGLEVLYDGGTRIYVTVSPKFINKTCGLCGTFNNMQYEDFKTPEGIVDTNPLTFGNSWNIDLTCPIAKKKRHPCDMQVQKAKAADKKCNKLRSVPFTACHNVVDPQQFILGCSYDFCKSRDTVQTLCTAVASYTKECAGHGIIIEWRNSNVLTECCKLVQVYNFFINLFIAKGYACLNMYAQMGGHVCICLCVHMLCAPSGKHFTSYYLLLFTSYPLLFIRFFFNITSLFLKLQCRRYFTAIFLREAYQS